MWNRVFILSNVFTVVAHVCMAVVSARTEKEAQSLVVSQAKKHPHIFREMMKKELARKELEKKELAG